MSLWVLWRPYFSLQKTSLYVTATETPDFYPPGGNCHGRIAPFYPQHCTDYNMCKIVVTFKGATGPGGSGSHQMTLQIEGQQGGIIDKEMPVDRSNIMMFNPQTGKGDKIGIKTLEDNSRVRYFKSNNEVVDV